MDAKLKTKWVKALRSGQYQQYHGGALRYGDYFCCLGVLADLLPDAEWDVSRVNDDEIYPANLRLYDTVNDEYLPDAILPRDAQMPLAQMNDTGKDFATIADYIEKEL